MKVYLMQHAQSLKASMDPQRHISEKGREEADRVGARLRALGAEPVLILHSELQYTIDTAVRINAKLDVKAEVAKAAYPIGTDDPIEPFMSEIAAASGDIMMCGHFDYLERSASHLVCGHEAKRVFRFKPGTGTLVCMEREGDEWVIIYAWRQDQPPG